MTSLLPYFLNELRDWEEPAMQRRPRHWFDDVDDILADYARPAPALWLHLPSASSRPRQLNHRAGALQQRDKNLRGQQSALMVPQYDNNGLLNFNVDVQDYRPEELSVQVLKDQGCVVVEGRHEERGEHSFVQHQFTRRYKLPSDVDPDTVTSRLSPDGVLQVTVPRKDAIRAPPQDNVRQVDIVHSNQPAAVTSDYQEVNNETGKSKEVLEGEKKGEPLAA